MIEFILEFREGYHSASYVFPLQPQYVFLHDALLESIECGVSEVPARELAEQYKKLGLVNPEFALTGLGIEFNKLQSTIHIKPSKSASAMSSSKKKNRYANEEMLPCE